MLRFPLNREIPVAVSIAILLFLIRLPADAQIYTPEAASSDESIYTPEGQEPSKSLQRKQTSRELRGLSRFTASYELSPLGFAIPLKHGPFLTWIASDKWSFEASYFSGSFGLSTFFADIGEIRETLTSLISRAYMGNSFNFLMGIGQQSWRVRIGDDLLSRLSAGNLPGGIDLLKVDNYTAILGLGNRWQLENGLTFGADWLVLYIPVVQSRSEAQFLQYVNNQNDRENVEDVLSVMRWLPSIATIKLMVGYTF